MKKVFISYMKLILASLCLIGFLIFLENAVLWVFAEREGSESRLEDQTLRLCVSDSPKDLRCQFYLSPTLVPQIELNGGQFKDLSVHRLVPSDTFRVRTIYWTVSSLLIICFLFWWHWRRRSTRYQLNLLRSGLKEIEETRLVPATDLAQSSRVETDLMFLSALRDKLVTLNHDKRTLLERFQIFNAHVPDCSILIDDAGVIIDYFGNERLMPFTNKIGRECLDKNIIDLVDHEFAGKVIATIQKAMSTYKLESFETYRTENNEKIYIGNRMQALSLRLNDRAVVVWTSSNITARKKQDEQLELLAKTFETNEGILIADHDESIIQANRACTKHIGWTASAITNYSLSSIFSEEETLATILSETRANGGWHGEVSMMTPQGEQVPVQASVSVTRDEKGFINHFIFMFVDITDKKESDSLIQFQAFFDPLTELPNRRLLMEKIELAIETSIRSDIYGAVLFIDLDHFKQVNDTFGHQMGDELLKAVSKRIQLTVRKDDTVARLGGDEFVVLLEQLDGNLTGCSMKAQQVAEKIIEEMEKPVEIESLAFHCSASVGITCFPKDRRGLKADDLLREADTSMYHAKNSGRNQFAFFDESMQKNVEVQFYAQDLIRTAIKENRLLLHYQPQLSIGGKVIGVEALMRCINEEGEMVPPDDFIPVAEETGLIMQLGVWLIEQVCKDILYLQEKNIAERVQRFSINISPKQFNDSNFSQQTTKIIRDYGLSPHLFELEITESSLITQVNESIQVMNELRDIGYSLALDDFGTGYSSLLYLKNFPINKLKIDKSFISDITTEVSDAKIVGTIIAMSRHLGMSVVAEGVETQEQLTYLMANGCSAFQGYYFYKPMTLDDLASLLSEQSSG